MFFIFFFILLHENVCLCVGEGRGQDVIQGNVLLLLFVLLRNTTAYIQTYLSEFQNKCTFKTNCVLGS